MVIEIQLTTTFVDVILGRNDFYRDRNIYILWVFYDLKNNFTQKDVLYDDGGYENLFLFDEEAKDTSIRNNNLYLKCLYKKYYCNPDTGEIKREKTFTSELIKFDDLKFDKEKNVIYYYSPIEAKEQLKEKQHAILCEIERKKIEENRKYTEYLKEELARLEQEQKQRIEEQKKEEARRKAEEEQRKKEEAERKENERLNNIKRQQQTKIEECVYSESISLDDFWNYYQQLNDDERRFADNEIHSIIIKSVYHRYSYYENRYSFKYDKNIKDFYYFLLKNKYPFDWEQFKNIPEEYFIRSYDELNMNLYEYITLNLYVNHNYHLPDKDKEGYLSQIIKRFEDIIEESKIREKYTYCAASFNDIEMIILCFERVNESPFGHEKTYINLYTKNGKQ